MELNDDKYPIRYSEIEEAIIEYNEIDDQLLLVLGNAEGIIKNNKNPKDLTNLVPGLSAEETTILLDLSTFRNNPRSLSQAFLRLLNLYNQLKKMVN